MQYNRILSKKPRSRTNKRADNTENGGAAHGVGRSWKLAGNSQETRRRIYRRETGFPQKMCRYKEKRMFFERRIRKMEKTASLRPATGVKPVAKMLASHRLSPRLPTRGPSLPFAFRTFRCDGVYMDVSPASRNKIIPSECKSTFARASERRKDRRKKGEMTRERKRGRKKEYLHPYQRLFISSSASLRFYKYAASENLYDR